MSSEREGRRPRIGAGRTRINYRDDNNSANESERKPAYSTRESFQREMRPNYENRSDSGRVPYDRERRNGTFNRDRNVSPFRENRPRNSYVDRSDYGNREDGSFSHERGNFASRPRYGEGYDGNRMRNDRPRYSGRGEEGSYSRPRGNNRAYDNRRSDRQRSGDYNSNAKYNYQKQLKYKEEFVDPNEPIRLNKYLANSGICSRREADEYIQAGVVSVNGEVITELGRKVLRSDKVMFHNEPVTLESKVYVLLNKPKNCVTTSDDPQGRLTVMDLVRNACKERIYPIGRLDRNTTGVLLLTNDGELASKLAHPKYNKKKIYQVWLDKDVAMEDMQKIADGVELDDGEIHADAISYVTEEDKSQVGIEIHSGKNRVVRRIFEKLGYRVVKLDRVYFAGLTKKNLPRGRWRYLDQKEVNMLRMGSYE